MLFSHRGVAETLLYVSPEEAPDEILAAALLTLVEGTTREDGTAAVYLSTRATNDDPFAAFLASDRCLSVALADRDGVETAHVLVKANVTSLDDCPSAVPSDFDDDGAALDLEALGADGAVLARRPGADLAATWPDDIPVACKERREISPGPDSADRRPRRDHDRLLLRAPGLRAQRVAFHRPGRSHARGRCERGAVSQDRGGFRRRTRVEKRRHSTSASLERSGSPGLSRGVTRWSSAETRRCPSATAPTRRTGRRRCVQIAARGDVRGGTRRGSSRGKQRRVDGIDAEGSGEPVTRRSASFVHPARAKTKDKNHQPLKDRSTEQTHP